MDSVPLVMSKAVLIQQNTWLSLTRTVICANKFSFSWTANAVPYTIRGRSSSLIKFQ